MAGASIYLFFLVAIVVYTISELKQRKFYKENGIETQGIVTAWKKKVTKQGRVRKFCYDIDVRTADNTYHIRTYSVKARKYRHQKEITLLVIKTSEKPDFKLTPEELASLSEGEKELEKEFLELQSQVQTQIATINSMMGQRSAIIKEELKTPFSFIFYGFAAVCCALMAILCFAEFMFS